jgi:hypothetical protein
MKNATRHWIMTALFCAGLVVVTSQRVALAQAGSAGGSIGNEEKSLSGTRETVPERPARKPAEETHRSRPSSGGGGGNNFDGAWIVVSVGTTCSGGSRSAVVVTSGRIVGQGVSGQVSANGSVSAASSVNGIAITNVGRLSGRSGSGTFRQSDGCSGRWTAMKQ